MAERLIRLKRTSDVSAPLPPTVNPGELIAYVHESQGHVYLGLENNAVIRVGAGTPSYIHTQAFPNTTWTINHNLGYFPVINLVGSDNFVIEAEIEHININQAIARLTNASDGTAHCQGDFSGPGSQPSGLPNWGYIVGDINDQADLIALLNTKVDDLPMNPKTYRGRTTNSVGQVEDVPVATLKIDLALIKDDVGLSNVNNTSDMNKPVSTAQSAADAIVLGSAQAYADSLVLGLWDDRGDYDPVSGVYPVTGGSGIAGVVVKGDTWRISASGTLPGGTVIQNDLIRALVDTPGQTPTSWVILKTGGEAFSLKSASTNVNVSAATAPTAGQVLTATSGTAAIWRTPLQYMHIRDERENGVDGGDTVASTFNLRPLNTVVFNNIAGASLLSDEVTLPAGSYRVYAQGSVRNSGVNKLRFYNVTDATAVCFGSNADASGNDMVHSIIAEYPFTINDTKVFRLEHWTASSQSTNGLGGATSIGIGTVEVYGTLIIIKDTI